MKPPPQALTTTYPARLATYSTALLGPPVGVSQIPERRTKRGTAAVNYAELDVDDDSEPALRSHAAGGDQADPGAPAAPGQRRTAPFETSGKPAERRAPPYRSETQLARASDLPTVLIPIRLDLDLASGRIHDTFLWNLHETLITPETFAATMVEDMELPATVIPTIVTAIRDQLAEYAPVAQISLPESSGEMRTVCSLTVNLEDVVYADRFEWDLTNSLLPPESFAKNVAADLGLRSEFIPVIAAGIYEFSLQKKKDLYEAGMPELDNAAARTDGSDAGWRLDNEALGADWEPRVELLSREEIEKREIDREREVRRLRRETARFGTGAAPGPDVEAELGRGGRNRGRKRGRDDSPTPVEGEWDRRDWRCNWCSIAGSVAWGAGDGPDGSKTLCSNCSSQWRDGGLQEWSRGLHQKTGFYMGKA